MLVSSSPRRQALLRQIGLEFHTFEPSVDESLDERLAPDAHTVAVARRKLSAFLSRELGEGSARWAVAADTVLWLDGEIIGKPADRSQARTILRRLSGRVHTVTTGLAVWNPSARVTSTDTASTLVTFAALDPLEIERYLDAQEWQGAAGGYRIQERGALLVEGIAGSYSNVVGLPIRTFYGMVAQQGYTLFP
ncbi:MAG TPA: Maf family protein [Spirochaetia bacterium]|nr:Maf family protein [Spirochaetia bacterium]